MLNKPEEFILALIAVLWLIFSYYLCVYLGVNTISKIWITLSTLLWCAVVFLLWRYDKFTYIWPIALGFLVACWWPYLDWLAIKDLNLADESHKLIVISRPWFASWSFKLMLSATPLLLGYIYLFFHRRKMKRKTQTIYDSRAQNMR